MNKSSKSPRLGARTISSSAARKADGAAAHYSLVSSAKANQVEPFAWLKHLFTQLPSLPPRRRGVPASRRRATRHQHRTRRPPPRQVAPGQPNPHLDHRSNTPRRTPPRPKIAPAVHRTLTAHQPAAVGARNQQKTSDKTRDPERKKPRPPTQTPSRLNSSSPKTSRRPELAASQEIRRNWFKN